MQSGSSFILTQLLGQAPILILYLTGVILGIAFRTRSPLASTLVLIGAGLNLAVSVMWIFILHAAYTRNNMLGIQAWSIAGQLLHTAAHALILSAAFVGRKPNSAAFEVQTANYAPPPPVPVRPLVE